MLVNGVQMSDTAQGPSWWQAGDGRWYPPELRRPPTRRQAGKPSTPPAKTARTSGSGALAVLDDVTPSEDSAALDDVTPPEDSAVTDQSGPATQEGKATTSGAPPGAAGGAPFEPGAEPTSRNAIAASQGADPADESGRGVGGPNRFGGPSGVGSPNQAATDRQAEDRADVVHTTPAVTGPEKPAVPSAFSLPVRPVAASRPTRGSTPRSGIPTQLLRPRRGGSPRAPADVRDPAPPPDPVDEHQVSEGTAGGETASAVTEPIEDPRPPDAMDADVVSAEMTPVEVGTASTTTSDVADLVDVADVPYVVDVTDVVGLTGDGLQSIVSMDTAGTDGATEADLQATTWGTVPWEATAETGSGGARSTPDAAPEWASESGVGVSPLDRSGSEGFSEEIDPTLPSPAGPVASVTEPLSIHSLLFGVEVPPPIEDDGYGIDDADGGDDADDAHDPDAPTELASGEWTPAPPAPEAQLSVDHAAYGEPATTAGEAPAVPPFVLVPPEPPSQVSPYVTASVPPTAAAEPVVTGVPPFVAGPASGVPPFVVGPFAQADADVLAHPVPVAPGAPNPAQAGQAGPSPVGSEAAVASEVPTETGPAPSVALLAGTATPKPETTSTRAKKNADLFKGGPEFPDIFKLAMEGTSIGSNVSVRYDAASPRAKEAAVGTPKGSTPTADDKAGKRRRRRSH